MPPKRKATGDIKTKTPDGSGGLSDVLVDFVKSGKNATVTCGGSIALPDVAAWVSRTRETPLSQASGPRRGGKKKGKAGRKSTTTMEPSPIALYWDRPDGEAARVMFPVPADNMTALEDFMSDCQPAGFGFQGEEKYDENVRRAWAMDASRFATNVCPYALGIVDRIEQLLLPNVDGIGRGGVKDGGYIRAERYKINVYKGPSDFFKSHIDTPRAKNQFGSLVLCLPSKHKGGQLIVNHVGSSIRYDWDKTQASQALQWAALYSDCEHEVLEVTSGYRVTLTFNLYYEPRASRGGDPLSGLRSKPAPVDITSLAPYGVLQELLQDQEWMTNGGNLGIYCAHAYPTTTSNVEDVYPRQSDPPPDPLPSDAITALKGTDASIYAVLYFLGLNVSLKPVIQKPEIGPFKYHEDDEFPLEVTSVDPGMVMTSREVYNDSEELIHDMGEKLDPVVWVNTALWKSLAFIHGYEGNEPEPPGITYSYMSLVAAIPPAAERINKPKRQKKGRDN